jgi:hypothetical protein
VITSVQGKSKVGGDFVEFVYHLPDIVPEILVFCLDVLAEFAEGFRLPYAEGQHVDGIL